MNNLLKSAQQFGELWASWIGAGGRPVDSQTSQHRADICLVCPKHERRPIYEALAGPVAKIVRAQIEMKNKMKLRVEGEKSLGVCGACNCVMALKCHVPIEFILETTETKDLDPSCWITDK